MLFGSMIFLPLCLSHYFFPCYNRGAGVNALQVKDSGGNLPLHIATAVGAPYSIVELLVRHYADGCYRRTLAGDLPVHLHVMSGNATTSSVELLIAPLANSPSGLRAFSSKGFVLPIHVAVQYQVVARWPQVPRTTWTVVPKWLVAAPSATRLQWPEEQQISNGLCAHTNGDCI